MKRITFLFLLVFAGFMAFSQGQTQMTEAQKLEMLNAKSAAEADTPVFFKSGTASILPGVSQRVKPLLWQEVDYGKAAPDWIHWDNGVNYDAIGTGAAANFMVAARFTPSDLAEYSGAVITKIKFVPYYLNVATFTLKVWQGSDPPNEVYSQAVSNLDEEVWNEIELDEVVPIDFSEELWVGYEVSTTTGYPAGCDAGPQVAGKGNMMFYEGVWQELTELNSGLTYNWNIQAYVEVLAEPGAPAAPLNLTAEAGAEGALNVTLNWNNPAETFDGGTLTSLDKVYVYRGEELILTINNPVIGADATYVDDDISVAGLYGYSVYGTNDVGEGAPANISVFVGPDVPEAPGNPTLVAQGNDGLITWTAPVTGLNGGYIVPAGVTYDVVRMPGEVEVATDLNDLQYLDTEVPGIGNYYYIVTASNDLGVGGSEATNQVLLGAEGVLMYEMFDYEVGTLPPGWTVQGMGQGNWSVVNSSSAGGTPPELRLYWSPAFVGLTRLVSHSINVEGYASLRFKYKQYLNNFSTNEGEIAAIDVSYDGGDTWTAVWEYEIIDHVPMGDYEQYIDVPDGATELKIGIRFDGDIYNINYWYFDNMVLEPVVDHDLFAKSISGNVTPSVDMESAYTITIQNAGTETATGYTVKLMREGGIELDQVAGNVIEFAEIQEYQLVWTPEAGDEGNTFIYGLIEYDEDMVPGNNRTSNLDLIVQAAGTIAVTIGTGSADLYMPFNFLYEKSLAQTLYYPEEIGLGGGLITALQYTSNFNDAFNDKFIQIWMGETELEDLSGGWVDPASLQLVYEGTYDFPGGVGPVLIPLQDHYTYGGGNLVIYTHKDDDDWTGSKYFKGANDPGSNRSRRAQQDNNPMDPDSPPAGTANHDYPNIVIFMTTEGLGALGGFVTDDTYAPLEGVKVSLLGTMSTAYTNTIGFYEFPYLLPGTYDVQFELYGYETQVIEDVVVIEDMSVLRDAVMVAIPQYTVSGTIKGNDNLLIEGALVKLEGYEDYDVLTDADGEFSIEDVYEGTYVLTIDAVGYEPYIDDELEVSADTDLGIITIIEMIITPFAVMVDVDNQEPGNALLTWNSADTYFADSFEDGTLDAWHEFIPGPGTPGDGGTSHWYPTTSSDGGVIPDGSYVAKVDWGYDINTWLISPLVAIKSETSVVFNWYSSYYWSVDPNPNAELMIKVSTDGGNTWEEIWNWQNIGVWTNFTWYESTVSLSDYAGQAVHVAVQLMGSDNAVSQIDNVRIGEGDKAGTIALTEPTDAAADARTLSAGTKVSKAFVGFNVFLDDEEVASEIEDTEYLFTGLEEGDYTAGVQAIYTTGSSEIVTADFQIVFGVPMNVQVTTNSGDDAEGAEVTLANQTHPQYSYTATTDADGLAAFASVRKGLYTLTVSLEGFEEYEEADIDIQETATIEAELIEIITAPFGLMAEEGENAGEVLFSWNNAMGWAESFEGGVIPEDWEVIVNNPNQSWQIVGTVSFTSGDVVPVDGEYQAYCHWDYGHQDEWLITPPFTAPMGDLTFWYYGTNGSIYDDHYYVKISTDGGNNWTAIWDASALPAGENHYAAPAVIDLSDYVGQEVQLAWQNVDGDGQGLWYAWFLDDITVGDVKIDVKDLIVATNGNITEATRPLNRDGIIYPSVNPADMMPVRNNKSFVGYNVFLDDMVTPVASEITGTEYLFTGLTDGDYLLGVQSVYTSGGSDIITLPFTVTNGVSGEVYTVTFNVHMHEVEFTEDDVIYISGSMLNWATPGDEPENQTMEPTDDPNIFTKTFELAEGTYAYKYFLNEGWDNGEWPGDPDRQVVVEEDMVIDDVFGNIDNPVTVPVVEAGELMVYPNPAHNVLNIVSGEMIRELRIIDLLGQVVYVSDAQGEIHTVNVGQFRDGIYFVQVLTSKGIITQRIQIAK